MTSPNPARIDRTALDRIIQRAAELQTGDREVGDNLSADEVLALGQEVGIPARYLQQAILEHQTTVAATPDTSLVGRALGPAEVMAQRVVQGTVEEVLRGLAGWMEKNELLVVQRQQTGWISWEPLRGMQAAIRRGAASLDTSKPKFMLSRAELVVATVTALEKGYCHVSITATLKGVRKEYLIGSLVSVGCGGGLLAAAMTMNVLLPVALVPVGASVLIAATVLRRFRPIPARIQMGLDRALDFLERGGARAKELPDRGPGLLDVLASEVRRALTSGKDK